MSTSTQHLQSNLVKSDIFPIQRKENDNFCPSTPPQSFEILTRNLREVIGLGLTRVHKYVGLGRSDQGQVGGQHVPVRSHGEALRN